MWRTVKIPLALSAPLGEDIRARDLGNHRNVGLLPEQPVPVGGETKPVLPQVHAKKPETYTN